MLSDETIKSLKDYQPFMAFQSFMVDKVDELYSISGAEKLSNEAAGEEVKARAKARRILIDILQPFADFNERKAPSEAAKNEVKRRYAL